MTLALAVAAAISTPTGADGAEPGNGASVMQAWGDNSSGQTDLPSDLRGGLKAVMKISLGHRHGTAVTADKKLYAWGDNSHGEGSVPDYLQNLGAIDVASGWGFNVVLGDDFNARVWGDTPYGLDSVPQAAVDVDLIQVAAGGNHALAKSSGGKVFAWGGNNLGQTDVPTAVKNTTIKSIAAGVGFSLALSSSGKVYAWGTPSYGLSTVPPALEGKTVVQIAAGRSHALALTSDNEIVAWGDNSQGALNVPALAPGDRWTQIAAGDGFSSGVAKDSQTAGVWGSGATGIRQPPPQPSAGSNPVSVAAGGDFLVQGFKRLGVIAAPTVTRVEGVFRVGTPVQASHATFGPDDATVTKTGEWFTVRNDVVIKVGTGMTYTPKATDIGWNLVFRTRAVSTSYGSAYSDTAQAPVKGTLFTSVTRPVITGDAYIGSTLKGSLSSVPAADSYRYDWYADGVYRKTSDTRGEYVVQEADRGKKITLMGYADKAGHERIAAGTSEPTATVLDAPQFQVSMPPMVKGTARVGSMLGVTPAVVSPTPAQTSYQWYRNGQPISGATDSSYRAARADDGRSVGVMLTFAGPGRRDTVAVSPSVTIGKAAPRLIWTAKQGSRSGSKRYVGISVAVSAAGVPSLTGVVKIRDGSKVVKTLTLRRGRASTVVKLARGKRTIKVTYYGTTGVHATSLTRRLNVK
ncbi:hypothetical protein ASE19_04185 [Nocardioides sp. Root79]|nr:hypothetical protein ASE19_04185 [Nocardioides sp. Root79]KRC77215.1 hypothetical protein ASE20_03050 [Nocardioides sp. Root240]